MPARFDPHVLPKGLMQGARMPADKRFHERIQRIERGRTWVPDGVVHYPASHRHRARRGRRGGGAGTSILMLLAVPVALALAGPERLPDPVRGFFTAPTTEAAMASLGEWAPLSGVAR
jgi:hypothetical protein